MNSEVLKDFLRSSDDVTVAAAFYNKEQQLYEPVLAFYTYASAPALMKLFEQKQYSLQYFLQTVNAEKYYPEYPESMTSIDTPEERAILETSLFYQNRLA